MPCNNEPRPCVESLERRRMLAGNVTVSVVDGDLMIQGDREPNAILVSQEADGTFVVTGAADDDDALPTTVNGAATGTFAGLVDDFRIRMGRGDDRVEINGIDVPDDYSSRDINGDDTTLVTGSTIGDRFKHFASNDVPRHDVRVVLNDTEVAALTSIRTGMGNNWVEIVGSTLRGDDSRVDLWSGDDVFKLIDSRVDGSFRLSSSDGADRVWIEDVVALDVLIVTGSGDDFVRILRMQSETMGVGLGYDDDVIRIRGTTVTGRENWYTLIWSGEELEGDDDTDLFVDEGANNMSELKVEGFQNM